MQQTGTDPLSALGLFGVMGFALLAWGGGWVERTAFTKIFNRFFSDKMWISAIVDNVTSLVTLCARVTLIYAIWLYARNAAFAIDRTDYFVSVHFVAYAFAAEFLINYLYNGFSVYSSKALAVAREAIVIMLVAAIGVFYLLSLVYATKNSPRNPYLDVATNETTHYPEGTGRSATFFKVITGLYGCVWAAHAVIRIIFFIMSLLQDDKYWESFMSPVLVSANTRAAFVGEGEEAEGLTGAYQ